MVVRSRIGWAAWLLAVGLAAAAGACNQSDFDYEDPTGPPSGLGTAAWGSEDVSCETDEDCNPGETCERGTCQMERCSDGPYNSNAPLGKRRTFIEDRELVVNDEDTSGGSYWIDGYLTAGGDVTYPAGGGSWRLGGKATDVAGGDFIGKRPAQTAAIVDGQVVVMPGGSPIGLSFAPVAIAAGDVDNDGVDELAAIASDGRIAICHLDESTCEYVTYSQTIVGLDVAIGDVDGDGFGEPVFLVKYDGDAQLRVWNRDKAITGQQDTFILGVDRDLERIAAGDLDGNQVDEVIAIDEGGWGGAATDAIVVYGFGSGPGFELDSEAVSGGTRDVTAADLEGTGKDVLVILRNDEMVEMWSGGTTENTLVRSKVADLNVSGDPSRITATDFDGDSPIGTMVEGPVLVPGKVVPTMVLHMPPYSRTHSSGVPYLDVGDAKNTGASTEHSVGLRASMTVGFEFEIPVVASAKIETTITRETTRTNEHETTYSVGNRVWIEADVESYGDDYAAVFLSCGCFHSYVYKIDDPAGKMGGDQKQFKVLMPVGGQATVWSSKRYNKMAEKVGGLPLIEVPYRIGDVSSYPTRPEYPDGSPISPQRMVFQDPPNVRVSDVTNVGWYLAVEENETNGVAMSTEIEVAASVEAFGFSVGGSAGGTYNHSAYAVTVGNFAEFIGYLPAVPDDRSTPDDEYASYAYTVQPIVYQQTYEDGGGNEAAYYVLSYAVGQ